MVSRASVCWFWRSRQCQIGSWWKILFLSVRTRLRRLDRFFLILMWRGILGTPGFSNHGQRIFSYRTSKRLVQKPKVNSGIILPASSGFLLLTRVFFASWTLLISCGNNNPGRSNHVSVLKCAVALSWTLFRRLTSRHWSAEYKGSQITPCSRRNEQTALLRRCWNRVYDRRRVVHAKLLGEADLKNLLACANLKPYIFVQSPEKSSPDLESVTIPGFFIIKNILHKLERHQ